MPTTRRTGGGTQRRRRLEEAPLPPVEPHPLPADDEDEPDLEFLVYQMHPEFLTDDDEDEDEEVESEQAERRILHIRTHVVVENQIRDSRSPFVAEAVSILEGAGVDPHDARHLLGEIVMHHVWASVRDGRPYDPEAHQRDVSEMVARRLEEATKSRTKRTRRKAPPRA